MAYQDSWGRFYSAYSPVFDSNGKVAGIVAVDFGADWYDNQMSKQIMTTLIICLAALTFGTLAVLLIAARSRKRFGKLYKEVNNLSDGIATLASELGGGTLSEDDEELRRIETDAGADTNDEISRIGEKIRALVIYLGKQIVYVRSME